MVLKVFGATLAVLVLLFSCLSPSVANDVKVVAKKTATPIPSPSPKWPPVGFKGKDGVFAKVPTRKELIGLLSAKRTLQTVVKTCEEFACGAVIVAAETGCAWWEVNSKVFRTKEDDPALEILGSLTTNAKGSAKKAQTTIFLLTTEKLMPEVYIGQIKVVCHRSASDAPKIGNVYIPNATPSPTTSN